MIRAIQPAGQNKNQAKIAFTAHTTMKLMPKIVEESFLSTVKTQSAKYQKTTFNAPGFIADWRRIFKAESKKFTGNAILKHAKTEENTFGDDFILIYRENGKKIILPIRSHELFKFTESGEPKVNHILDDLEIATFKANA